MSRIHRRVITWIVVVAWVVFYAVTLANADHLPGPVTAVVQLVVPPLLWVALLRIGSSVRFAAGFVRRWWSGAGSRLSTMDPPGRLLAAAVAALPERRREWGTAMLAELAEVQGRRRCVSPLCWTVIACVPLTYARWLPSALRRHAIDGRTLDGELVAPLGVNLADALISSLGIFPVLGLTFGVIGAAVGARRAVGANPS